MADTKHMDPQTGHSNQTMKHEQAKAEVGQRPDEKARLEKESREKGAIGGGETHSQAGEPGRARSELNPSNTAPTGQQR